MWLIDLNYYIASATGFIGNVLVILLSLKVHDKEVQLYKWIINFQSAFEAIVCVLALLLKVVCFNSFLLKICHFCFSTEQGL